MRKIMFSASWCGACQTMKPIMEDFPDVEIIDVEQNPELVEKYRIMSLPTFIIDDGENVQVQHGAIPKKLLEDFFYGKK